MCHHATFEVPPEPQSVPSTRHFCRETLTGWDLPHMVDDAQLVLSELVTNGLLHAGTPLAVTVSTETGNLEIAVSDGDPTVPVIRPRRNDLEADLDLLNAGAGAEAAGKRDDRDPRLDIGAAGSVVGGRGLQLVASLAEEWGVHQFGGGKSVWARLSLPAGWPPAVTCRCPAGGTRLSSGRTVTLT